jgi:excisionase family DNA binding protein
MTQIQSPKSSSNDPTALNSSRLAYRVTDACRAAGVGRTTLYGAIKDGELIARKIGRRTVILADDLTAWLRSLPPTAAK